MATMNGIDISSWQAGINIDKLTTTDFVIVKATGGTEYTNPYFTKHVADAIKAGKCVGAYHYARESGSPGSAADEAAYFVQQVRPYLGQIVLALDWEQELSLGPTWAREWLNTVYALTGVKPLLYTSQSVCASYDWSGVIADGYKLWLAQYANTKQTDYQTNPWQRGSLGAWKNYIMHQYSSTGRVTGYGGNLDLNLFYGSRSVWASLAASEKTAEGQGQASTPTAQASTEATEASTTAAEAKTSTVPTGETRYTTLSEVPAQYRAALDKLIASVLFNGKSGTGETRVIDLGEDAVRVLAVLDRVGIFG